MSELATPIRGLRLMTFAAVAMMLRFAAELGMAAVAIGGDDVFGGLPGVLRWSARLRLIDLTALTLFAVGVASSVGELRRRKLSVVPAVLALVAFVITFAVNAWMYDLLTGLAHDLEGHGSLLSRLDQLEQVPVRVLLATLAYLGGLFATVRMVRGYAMTDGNLGLREQARAIAGLLILLLVADTFYRFTYGLGGGDPAFGPFGIAVAIGVMVFWLYCHRRLGHLFDTAKYYLRETAGMPIAAARIASVPPVAKSVPPGAKSVPPVAKSVPPAVAAVTSAPPVARSAPPVAPAPSAPLPTRLAPTAAEAPRADAPTPIDGGPRLLR